MGHTFKKDFPTLRDSLTLASMLGKPFLMDYLNQVLSVKNRAKKNEPIIASLLVIHHYHFPYQIYINNNDEAIEKLKGIVNGTLKDE